MNSGLNKKVYFVLCALVMVWGLAWPISKVGLQYLDPVWYSTGRFWVGIAAAVIYLIVTKELKIPHKKDLPMILSVGIFQMAVFLVLLNVGLKVVGAGRASILVYSTPIWVTPLAVIFFKEKLNFLKTLGLIFGVAGLTTLFSPWGFDWSEQNVLIGNLILVSAAIVWAGVMLHMRYGKWHSTPWELLPWQMLLAGVLTLVAAFILEPHPHVEWNAVLISTLLYNGLLATAFAYWATMYVTRALPVVTTSISYLGVPVVGLLSSVIFLSEELTLSLGIALILIVAGVGSMTLGSRQQKS